MRRPANKPGMTGVQRFGSFPGDLWRRASLARHRLLVLDYDGTLAPLKAVRHEARPLVGIRGLLEKIAGAGRTEVAVLSGRPLVELERFMAMPELHYVGEHGWEIHRAGGAPMLHEITEDVAEALSNAEEEAAAAGLAAHLERKRTALVLHTRGLGVRAAEELEFEGRGLWEPATSRGKLALREISGGLELRARPWHKGTAVRELMAGCPPNTFPVCVGDDETDEDAFHEVSCAGFAIKVGHGGPSFASTRLESCVDVRSFLARWLLELEAAPFRRWEP
jgi:trehalose-phosphatase